MMVDLKKIWAPTMAQLLEYPAYRVAFHHTMPRIACVYFLFLRGRIVYIGRTGDLRTRLCSLYKKHGMRFTHVRFMDRESAKFESACIMTHCPQFNIRDNPKRRTAETPSARKGK